MENLRRERCNSATTSAFLILWSLRVLIRNPEHYPMLERRSSCVFYTKNTHTLNTADPP